jgi:alkylation response protein AidB-like acyl-CoA dehydrogenase
MQTIAAVWLNKTKELAQTELKDLGQIIEQTDEISDESWQRLVNTGLLRLTLKKEYGGEGLSMTEYFPILEECAKCQGSIRMIVHGSNGLWRILDLYADEEMKTKYLPTLARGAYNVFIITEPGTGSGKDIKTTACRTQGGWVLNGQKHWGTLADRAQAFYIIARASDERGKDLGISAFLVEPNRPGLKMEHMSPTMGCRGIRHDVLTFENCWLPEGNVIGKVGQGLEIAFRGFLDISRLSIANSCVGVSQAALEDAVAFARERVTFGKPIANRQYVQGAIAEMATDVHAARLMVQDAARKYDGGATITREASMAKFFCLEMAGRVTDRSIRIHGGLGYTQAYRIERLYRDVRGMWFEEGTAEIQKTVIARDVLDRGV